MNTHTAIVPCILLLAALLVAGCSHSKKGLRGQDADVPAFNAEQVDVLVEGRHRGVTPMTLNVSRARGEYEVALLSGKEVVRLYEIGIGGNTRSPERHIINMDLERDNSGLGFKTFDLNDLESPNDTLYIIPYLPRTVTIDDRKYGLTLVISDN